jgi:excisionase family DNA binding protein
MIPAETTLLTPAEVAEILRLKPDTVRRWAVAGRLPGVVFIAGKTLRFRRDAIELLVQAEADGS